MRLRTSSTIRHPLVRGDRETSLSSCLPLSLPPCLPIFSRYQSHAPVTKGGYQRCAGNGQHPGPYDSAGHAPANGAEPLQRADAENGAGDRMGGADGNTAETGHDQGGRRSGFRAKTVHRSQFDNALPHGLDDAPAAKQCPYAHRHMTGQDRLRWDIGRGGKYASLLTGGNEQEKNDAHGFLSIVPAVPQAIKGSR